jgi:hypothetical protein
MSLITEAQIRGLLLVAEGELSPAELERWARLRIEPESWVPPDGDDFGFGFWVVARQGNQVVWYNHLTEGFQLGKFTKTRKIDAAGGAPSRLAEVMAEIEEDGS